MLKHGVMLLGFVLATAAHAADWFAAPDATIGGDGSLEKPWPLQVAFNNPASAIHPGDTLCLRGGTYHGPFISHLNGTADNYITVRSAPREWAIIKDPLNGLLSTNLSSASGRVDNVPVIGSEYWPNGTAGIVGVETMYFYDKQGTNWSIGRGWNGSSVTSHSVGDTIKPNMDFMSQYGSYVMFRDFEITSDLSTNRVVGMSNWLGTGLNLLAGPGNKAVDLIVHNVGHPGIGFWNQRDGGEVNGCIVWGNGIYDNEGTWVRGGGIYAQNDAGLVEIKNNIFFRNFRAGTRLTI